MNGIGYGITPFMGASGILARSSGGGGGAFVNEYSMTFDGSLDYFNGASTFSELDGQNKATFSMWIKPTNAVTSIISSVKNSGSTEQFRIVFHSSRYIIFRTGTRDTRTANASIDLNVWTHIAIFLDYDLSSGTKAKIFINGVDATISDAQNATSLATSGGVLYVGARDISLGSLLPFVGLMDELAMWVGSDQRANVSDIYNGGVPFDLSTLATAPDHWWRMGDNDTWNGSQWTLTDNIGSYDLNSVSMPQEARLPISPNSYSLNSFAFDGIDDYFDCGSFSAYDNGDLSASVWVKKSSMQTFEYIISNSGSSARAGFDIIFENAFRKVKINRRTRTSDTGTAYLDIGFTLNNWHNIAFTYKDSTRTLKVYRDGILQSTTIGSASTNSASLNLTIGSFQGSSNFSIANIDEVSVFNSELSESDISTIFNNGVPQDISSLSPISHWRMGESATWNGSTWTMTDQGSGGNDATSSTLPESAKTGDQPYVL